jgi:hypothetical protein
VKEQPPSHESDVLAVPSPQTIEPCRMSFWESVQLAVAFTVSGAVPLFWSKVRLHAGGAG